MKLVRYQCLRSLLALSFLSAISAPAATLLDAPTVADIGVGWISTNSGSARWDLHIHDEVNELEYEPDEAILVVNNNAFFSSPGGLLASILGPSGTPNWRIPQTLNPSVLYLGVGGEEVGSGIFVGDLFTLSLSSVSGPGEFAMFSVDGFGVPTAFFNTRDGITGADAITIGAGAHAHYQFSFSEVGTYTVTLQGSGTLVAGSEFTSSTPVDYTFVVVPEPSTYALLAGGGLALGVWQLRRRRPRN